MAPKRDMTIHARDTTARPSLAYRAVLLGRRNPRRTPARTRKAIGTRNGSSDSPYMPAVRAGTAIKAASTRRIRPMTKPII